MKTFLLFQFRQWAESAVQMRDAASRNPDGEAKAILSGAARADAEKARFFYQSAKQYA